MTFTIPTWSLWVGGTIAALLALRLMFRIGMAFVLIKVLGGGFSR